MMDRTSKCRYTLAIQGCVFLFLSIVASSIALANPYKITVLATNISDYGGLGEWSFSAVFEGEEESVL